MQPYWQLRAQRTYKHKAHCQPFWTFESPGKFSGIRKWGSMLICTQVKSPIFLHKKVAKEEVTTEEKATRGRKTLPCSIQNRRSTLSGNRFWMMSKRQDSLKCRATYKSSQKNSMVNKKAKSQKKKGREKPPKMWQNCVCHSDFYSLTSKPAKVWYNSQRVLKFLTLL